MITNDLIKTAKFLDRLHLSTNPAIQQSYKNLQTLVLLDDSVTSQRGPIEDYIINTENRLTELSQNLSKLENLKMSPWNDASYNSWMTHHVVGNIICNTSLLHQVYNSLLPLISAAIDDRVQESKDRYE